MFHSLTMFLAPENVESQATLNTPPANDRPVSRQPGKARHSVRLMAAIAGNAIGFGALLAGCWFSLQLMQAALL